jgi:hypothetical protein
MQATRFRGTTLLTLGLALGVGCQSMQVTTDFDRFFRFGSARTYAWLPDPSGHAGDPLLHNDLIDGRVRAAVDRELQTHGYTRVPVDEADIHVTYYLGLETVVSWRMVSQSYHYSSAGFADRHRTETYLRQFEQGTLLIDVLDPSRRRLVWRGTAQARVRRNTDPEQREAQIAEAVAQILDRFPPNPRNRPAEPEGEAGAEAAAAL